ncbi:MAG: hypothetical protein ACJAUH_001951 [Saprospiraceae bacterium]|jgi:hypothetical protein
MIGAGKLILVTKEKKEIIGKSIDFQLKVGVQD